MNRPEPSKPQVVDRLAGWASARVRTGPLRQTWKRRAVPDRWSQLLGQVTWSSFAVCMVTGVFLVFFYDPSVATVQYDGSYAPLNGVTMSRALDSTLDLSFEVRGGLLMRQLHHWSATLMIAALMLHILRAFFTGAFRKPRRLSWVVLFLVLFTTMAAGFTGVALPEDLLSGSSLAVFDGVVKSVPFVGTGISDLVFGDQFPSGAIALFYPLHVLVLPAALLGLIAVLAARAMAHQPAQLPGPGRSERSMVTRPLRAVALRSLGMFFVIAGMLAAIAGTVTVNPVWLYGPADPGNASAGAGAQWYLAFLDGAQRLVPSGWELVWLDRTWTLAILVPVGVCSLFLLAAVAYPFAEARITGDRQEHHLLTRPRHTPTRTAIGAAGVTFYGVLWAAAGSDQIALQFSLGIEGVILALRLGLALGPVIAFAVTRRICLGLQRRDRDILEHGYETGRIVRMPDGGFHGVRRPVAATERWRFLGPSDPTPLTRGKRALENHPSGGL